MHERTHCHPAPRCCQRRLLAATGRATLDSGLTYAVTDLSRGRQYSHECHLVPNNCGCRAQNWQRCESDVEDSAQRGGPSRVADLRGNRPSRPFLKKATYRAFYLECYFAVVPALAALDPSLVSLACVNAAGWPYTDRMGQTWTSLERGHRDPDRHCDRKAPEFPGTLASPRGHGAGEGPPGCFDEGLISPC